MRGNVGDVRPSARRRRTIRVLTVLAALVAALAAGVLHHARSGDPALVYSDARGARLTFYGPPTTAYPWADAPAGGRLDPYGYPERQCTSFVAWYLNSHGVPFSRRTRGPAGVGRFDAAATWADAARSAGFTVSAVPLPGSVAQWRAGERQAPDCSFAAGPQGHVAVVLHVYPDGTAQVAEYDGRSRTFAVRRDRAPRYLYLGVGP